MTKTPLQKYRESPKGILTNIYHHQIHRKHTVSYTLSELHAHLLNNRRFLRMVKVWLLNGKPLHLKPVIDRIDPRKGYSLENIQVLTNKQNRDKQNSEYEYYENRAVLQLLDGKVYAEHPSQRAAVKNTGISQSNISSCLNGKRITAGGYGWQYKHKFQHPHLLERGDDE